MTKKDYQLIAGSLRMTNEWNGGAIRRDLFVILCENLANALNRDNPRFDHQRFLEACGIYTENCATCGETITHVGAYECPNEQ